MADLQITTDVLLSLLSHELRAPLGVVRGYLRMLEQGGGLDERQAKAVAGGTAGGDRLAALLDQASLLGRLVRAEVGGERRAMDVAALLERARAIAMLPSDPVVGVSVPAPAAGTVPVVEPLVSGSLAALVTAVARAQAHDTTITITAARHDDRTRFRVVLAGAEEPDRVPPDYRRGGQGLDLVLAGAVAAAHDGTLMQLMNGDTLAGFELEILG
ncbi:MAG: histidine kinase dimerization/phospho-acceptor domain-containing protein [Vicinamibacterales bacterium]